jgi:hypothetical protein
MKSTLKYAGAALSLLAASTGAKAMGHSAAPHTEGISYTEHLAFHAELTWDALKLGFRTGDFSAFWHAFQDQSICTTDGMSHLLFSPEGWASIGASTAIATFVCLAWRNRRVTALQRSRA